MRKGRHGRQSQICCGYVAVGPPLDTMSAPKDSAEGQFVLERQQCTIERCPWNYALHWLLYHSSRQCLPGRTLRRVVA